MTGRPAELIDRLGLEPHPEGGHFAEVHRSGFGVEPDDGRGPRAALTTIYFLLASGERSRFHRVRSDEVWHFYEGDPLELIVVPPDFGRVQRHRLGGLSGDTRPVAAVPAGWWQAARPLGAYTLAGCSVGPGFDFADFGMLADDADATERLRRLDPGLAALV